MRTLQVSADVYAAIWKRHQHGDLGEDDILRREFGLNPANVPLRTSTVGFHDATYDVNFSVDFEIHDRTKKLRPRANGGVWHLNGETYHSLNQLTRAVGSRDSAWRYWRFSDDATGEEKPISALCDPIKVKRKPRLGNRSNFSADELGL